MTKRPYSMHSDSDLRHSVESFKSNANKSAYYILIGYMNGTNSDKGWVLWKDSTLINICWHLDRRSVKKFMDSEEVRNKLIFGTDKVGDLWCTHSRTQSDLIEYFSNSKTAKFEPKNVQLCTESVQGLCKSVQTLCNYVQSTTHNPMNNNDSKIQRKEKESKENKEYVYLAQAQKDQDFEHYKNHDFVGETEEQKKDLDEVYASLSDKEDGSKKILEVVAPSKNPTAKEVDEYCKATTKIFPFPFDAEKWVNHWEAKKWVDKYNRSFDWKLKLIDMADDSRFVIKEKSNNTTTKKTGWVQQPTKMEQDAEKVKLIVKQYQESVLKIVEPSEPIIFKPKMQIEQKKVYDINDERFWDDTRKYF